MDLPSYIKNYLDVSQKVLSELNQQDIQKLTESLITLKNNHGRLFILGVGGSAGNCSHAINDFRKNCGIEAYAPTDNVSELTAWTNDFGFENIFSEWLKTSRLTPNDALLILSVGGGNLEKNVSPNIVKALVYAKSINAKVFGIVSRDGGYTKKVADVCVLIPTISEDLITPIAETFQALIWHAIINYELLAKSPSEFPQKNSPVLTTNIPHSRVSF